VEVHYGEGPASYTGPKPSPPRGQITAIAQQRCAAGAPGSSAAGAADARLQRRVNRVDPFFKRLA
jgi:hypothetical protein